MDVLGYAWGYRVSKAGIQFGDGTNKLVSWLCLGPGHGDITINNPILGQSRHAINLHKFSIFGKRRQLKRRMKDAGEKQVQPKVLHEREKMFNETCAWPTTQALSAKPN